MATLPRSLALAAMALVATQAAEARASKAAQQNSTTVAGIGSGGLFTGTAINSASGIGTQTGSFALGDNNGTGLAIVGNSAVKALTQYGVTSMGDNNGNFAAVFTNSAVQVRTQAFDFAGSDNSGNLYVSGTNIAGKAKTQQGLVTLGTNYASGVVAGSIGNYGPAKTQINDFNMKNNEGTVNLGVSNVGVTGPTRSQYNVGAFTGQITGTTNYMATNKLVPGTGY